MKKILVAGLLSLLSSFSVWGQTFTGSEEVIMSKNGAITTATLNNIQSWVLNSAANAAFASLAVNGAASGIAKFGNTTDWLSPIVPCTTNCASVWSQSAAGYIALLGASRTSDNGTAGSMGSIGVAGYNLNNNATAVQTGYAGYLENRRSAGAGTSQGLEIDTVNQGSVITLDPYNMIQTGSTMGLWLSSGRPDVTTSATNSSAAIGIINNNTAYEKGIVFQNTSLDTSSGEGGAIVLGQKHAIQWFGAAGKEVASIRSDATTESMKMVFGDGYTYFQDGLGNNKATINTSGNLALVGSASFGNGLAVSGAGTFSYNVSGTFPAFGSTIGGAGGLGLAWNGQGGGQGETDFINFTAGAPGGFSWFQANASGTVTTTPVMKLTGAGNLSTTGTGTLPVYSVSGTAVNAPHKVVGTIALASGTAIVTFSGNAVFTSSSSYWCSANDTSGTAAAVNVQNQSGTSVKFIGTGTDTVSFLCTGN
ncbi:hypothetical protein KDW63_03260 [Burkholderia cenocepacia]|uniref:hypothetical protein n=1 Tax=Burkholderia cenocepacia TaxID=95486 RepID=UPI001B9D3D65|nr:hypothetical protein [Burkholderia cenocepacia]MBR8293195.1 hypothetical protein [Burkholderia cenocepacia]